jgi:8-oxo-dGTP pyrophosphatase MutT (NUDIX family)
MSLPPTSPPPSTNKKIRPVISCLLKHGQEVLILKRSKHVGSFQGYWSCISGYLEAGEDPQHTAYREVFEETQLQESTILETIYAGPFYPEADDVIFETHWFLLETNTKEITLDWEHDECRWVIPEKFSDYQVVPWLPTLTDHLFAKRSAG